MPRWEERGELSGKTIDQFEYDGCDNCETYLQMKGNREMVYDCTSSSFDGIIAMMSPEDSWVSKWQRISTFKPGVYAVSVTGRLPQGTCEMESGFGGLVNTVDRDHGTWVMESARWGREVSRVTARRCWTG
ncbi:Transcription elongation factor SPT4 [Pitangus sulphuratus]|nr:Transcription elongation factor SPT4 [Pitangus sulphuratus]